MVLGPLTSFNRISKSKDFIVGIETVFSDVKRDEGEIKGPNATEFTASRIHFGFYR